MRKNNEVVFTPQQEENHEMVGNFRHFKDSIWWPVVKSLPRSTAVLLFPVMLIIGAFAYTRTLDTHVSILCYYYYPFTSNADRLNVCAIFNVIRCFLFVSYVTVVWSRDTLLNSLVIVRNGVWIPLARDTCMVEVTTRSPLYSCGQYKRVNSHVKDVVICNVYIYIYILNAHRM